jgi:hypothetical protein
MTRPASRSHVAPSVSRRWLTPLQHDAAGKLGIALRRNVRLVRRNLDAAAGVDRADVEFLGHAGQIERGAARRRPHMHRQRK